MHTRTCMPCAWHGCSAAGHPGARASLQSAYGNDCIDCGPQRCDPFALRIRRCCLLLLQERGVLRGVRGGAPLWRRCGAAVRLSRLIRVVAVMGICVCIRRPLRRRRRRRRRLRGRRGAWRRALRHWRRDSGWLRHNRCNPSRLELLLRSQVERRQVCTATARIRLPLLPLDFGRASKAATAITAQSRISTASSVWQEARRRG